MDSTEKVHALVRQLVSLPKEIEASKMPIIARGMTTKPTDTICSFAKMRNIKTLTKISPPMILAIWTVGLIN